MRAYKVYAIKEGTVIDHIKSGSALKVIEVLELDDSTNIISIGMNFDSKKVGKKDIIKIENRELSKDELDKIAIISPSASINIIKDHEVYKKFKVDIPNSFTGVIKCRNPQCITRNEETPSKFSTYSKDPLKVKCNYCEKVYVNFELL